MFNLEPLLPLLKVGDVVDTEHEMLPGLCGETVKATVTEVDENWWQFDLEFFGVFIAKVGIERYQGKLEWSELA